MNRTQRRLLSAAIAAMVVAPLLITRDAAMDQQRQNQEIQELVDAGVYVIGYDRLLENTTGVVQFGFVKTGELQAQALLVD